MENDETNADPFSRLLAVYFAQLSDDNSVARILLLYNKLSGQETTSGKLRRNLTALYEANLIEREEEKMLGTVKVSFHRILPLGEIAILYFFAIFVLNDLFTDFKTEVFTFKETMARQDTLELARLFLRECMDKDKTLRKYYSACKEGKNIERMKLNPIEAKIEPVLGGKQGFTFKIFEELLSDYLQTSAGKTKQEMAEKLERNVTPATVKSVRNLVITGKLGKITYYRLARKGIAVLPILLLLIRELSVDPEVIEARKLFFYPRKMDNPWKVMTSNAKSIFHSIYTFL
ncbi:MAG: hypothetical protein ACTSP4_08345 [Candidatus Hodarchaeales archaeon]